MTFLLGNNVVADTDETGNMANPNTVLGRQFTAAASGNAQQATVNLRSVGNGVYILLYDASEVLLSQGFISSSIDGDNTVTLSPEVAITSGNTYRIGVFPSTYTGWRGTGGSQSWDTDAETYPSIPNPFVDGGNQGQSTTPRVFIEELAPTTETATTGDIPLTIQAGYTLVDLVSPDTTNASLLFGADRDAPVTGDHLEYMVTSTLDANVSLSVAATGVWTVTETVEGAWVTDITVSRRVVQVDGSIGTEAVVTLEAATGVAVVKRYTLFDFGTVLPLGNANSINTTNVGQKVANAIDTDGSSTGISLSVAKEFDGQSDNTVDFPNGNPWGAENNIARDCVFTNGVGNGSIVLSGLNDSLIYTVEFASYRTGSGDQYTDFTINGTTQTVFSKGDTSVGGTTSFDVTPSSGSITIDVNESDGYTVGYLNAIRVSWPISTITSLVQPLVSNMTSSLVN